MKEKKVNSIISLYKHELNLTDTIVKIKNSKEILRHEKIPFQNSAKLEHLQALVLYIQYKMPMSLSLVDCRGFACENTLFQNGRQPVKLGQVARKRGHQGQTCFLCN